MQHVYSLISDNGDGSCSTRYFLNPTPSELAMLCDLETFRPSEGDPDHYTFDDSVDLTVAGFDFRSPDEFESDDSEFAESEY